MRSSGSVLPTLPPRGSPPPPVVSCPRPFATAGPGLIGRGFALTTAQTGMDLVRSDLHLRAGEPPAPREVVRDGRVGIADSITSGRAWRFYVRDSPGVSRK